MEQDLMEEGRRRDAARAAAARVAVPEPAPEEAAAAVPDRATVSRAPDRDAAGAEEFAVVQAILLPAEGRAAGDAASAEPHTSARCAQAEDRQMPGMDGTGPMGTGPIGGGRGPCGRGMGRGRGMGQGAGNRFGRGGGFDPRMRGNLDGRVWGQQYPGSEPTADRAALEEHVRMLENDLQAVRQRLDALGPATKEE